MVTPQPQPLLVPDSSSSSLLHDKYNHLSASASSPHPSPSPQILFPSASLPGSLPVSALSSASSTLSYSSSDVRGRPITPPSRSKSFRLPRFSFFGRHTPDTINTDASSTLAPPEHAIDEFAQLHLNNKPSVSRSRSSTDVQQIDNQVDTPTKPTTQDLPMPALTINNVVESTPMSSPVLTPAYRLHGGHHASPSAPAYKGRPYTADASAPHDITIVPPPSQFAAWSELLQGPEPPNRAATFSSVSSASCTSSARPNVKKVRSQDSIRSAFSVCPDSQPSTSASAVPVPKAVKTKLRSKGKAGKEADFAKVFLAQELRSQASGSVFRHPEALSPSFVQTEFFQKPCTEPGRKRSSWMARRSTSPSAVIDRLSSDRIGSPTRSGSVRSSVDNAKNDQHADSYSVRVRVDRQLSTGSHLTTASSGSSGNASDTLVPKSPVLGSSGEHLDLPEEAKCKRNKSTAPKRRTYALKFSLDGRYLAAAGSDHLIRVYEVVSTPAERAEEIEMVQLHRFEEACHKKAASACSNGAGRGQGKNDLAADLPQLAPVFKTNPIRVFAGHTADVMDLTWSKNNFLLSCGSDKTAKLWHPNRTDCLCTFATSATVSCIDFHPTDDRFFVTGGLDGKLRLWNISARRVQSINDVPGVITAVAFSTSGSVVCVGTHSGSLLTFSCSNSLSCVNTVVVKSAAAHKNTPASKITSISPIKLNTTTDGIASAAEGEYMTVTSNDSRVRIYSIASRRLISRFKSTSYLNKSSQIRATASSDSQYIVSGSEDAGIHVWSLANNASLLASLLPSALMGMKRNKSIKPSKGSPDVGDNSTWRSWSASSGCVRCAVFAPEATNALLAAAEDPIEKAQVGDVKARIIVSTDDVHGLKVWRTDPQGRLI